MIEFDARALDARCDCVQDLASLVRSSKRSGDVVAGKRAHARVLASEHRDDRYLANLLIEMYGNFGDLFSARAVFDSIMQPNVFSWTLLLAAYANSGHFDDARVVFDAIPKHCAVSWNTMLAAYKNCANPSQTSEFLARMPEPDVVSWTTVLAARAEAGQTVKAKQLFDSMPGWNSQSWNVMLGAYARVGDLVSVENVFRLLPQPDVVSWNYRLAANAQTGSLDNTKEMFNSMPLQDMASWTTLVAAFLRHSKLDLATHVFNKMPEWNVVVWNTLVSANAQNGLLSSAKKLFDSSPERDIFSSNSVLAAYAQLSDPRSARELFDSMPEHDVVSWNTMIAAFSHHYSHLDEARSLFDQMPARDIVSWNSIIAAYARNARGDEALKLFAAVDFPDLRNEATFASAVEACLDHTALSSGTAIHALIAAGGFSSSTLLANALIHMYGKCGCLKRAAAVFRGMWRRNEISWSSMASAMDENAQPAAAVALLPLMSAEGAAANEITFTTILTACAHVGTIEAAIQCFVSLEQDYGVEHRLEHYACVADLLGRSGWLPEAEELILAMPYEPDPPAVASLLAACRMQSDGRRGKRTVRGHVIDNVAESGPLVLLSGIGG